MATGQTSDQDARRRADARRVREAEDERDAMHRARAPLGNGSTLAVSAAAGRRRGSSALMTPERIAELRADANAITMSCEGNEWAGELIAECLDEIERLQARITLTDADIEAFHERWPDDPGRAGNVILDAIQRSRIVRR